MGTTREEIKEWLERGKSKKATHLIVVCDTFSYEDYPVFVKEGEDPKEIAKKYNNLDEMSRVMEVYDLSKNIESKLGENRSFNY
jgi:hypothetical protein